MKVNKLFTKVKDFLFQKEEGKGEIEKNKPEIKTEIGKEIKKEKEWVGHHKM